MKTLALTVTVFFAFCIEAATGNDDVDRLLDHHRRTQTLLSNRLERAVRVMSYTDSETAETFWDREESQFCTDSARIDLSTTLWPNLGGPNALPRDRTAGGAKSRRVIWDGTSWYNLTLGPSPQASRLRISTNEKRKYDHLLSSYPGGPLSGVFPGDQEPLADILSKADAVNVRKDQEQVNDASCRVIEATSKNGKYTIWVDPEHDYNIARAEVLKTGDDICYGEPLSTPHPELQAAAQYFQGPMPPPPSTKKTGFVLRLENTEFAKVGGIWVPMKAEWTTTTTYEGRRVITQTAKYDRTHVELSPDFARIKAFIPDVPNGTKTTIEGENPMIALYWQDGEARPDVRRDILKAIDRSIDDFLADPLLTMRSEKPGSGAASRATSQQAARPAQAATEARHTIAGPRMVWLLAVLVITVMLALLVWLVRRRHTRQ